MPKQTGPKTAEGKARSSRNALKHGMTSDRMFVLANETPEAWDEILSVWIEKLAPADDAELLIVQDIAHAQWHIRRARIIETGMLDLEMDDQFEKMASTFKPPVDEVSRLASAFKGLADTTEGLEKLHRYESRARRAFRSGLNALEQLRRMTGTTTSAAKPPATPPQPRGGVTCIRPPKTEPAPDPKKVQNEIRRERIRRVRITFGNRVPIRLIPPSRRKSR